MQCRTIELTALNRTMLLDIITEYAAIIALSICFAHATVTDIPAIFPAIPAVASFEAVDTTQYFKRSPDDFIHPGIWHTHEDLERIRENVLNNTEPWASTYQLFRADQYSLVNYTMEGPFAVISRGQTSNYSSFAHDARAAWQNALMWYITKDQSHWDRSTSILDAWGSNLTDIIGIDRSLLIGVDGDLFVNAAEIMRWEGNWTETGADGRGEVGLAISCTGSSHCSRRCTNTRFTRTFRTVTLGYSPMYHPETGQSVEAGRDQDKFLCHTMSGIGWSAYGARVGQSQGSDLYSLGRALLLQAAEYAANYNLNHTVVYNPQWYHLLYYEYVVRRGNQGPWTAAAKEAQGLAGGVTSNDHPSWGDLIWARHVNVH
ncbi:uncharacterized protein BDW43DRAFT_304709 [Aspergillus alliaceus]|uniref:uncharacterized protein n=1 Tax=Petromyces alliaceus TaxID=209559 RepID=UPI0012A64FB9|nr:chondroitin AC/alginate lyase [Aspergillus alliaceus]KAB8227308.1 chondroitin AC/alginate lyase [Aspergillus alliaceus]